MSDKRGMAAASLAITERKPQRTGGCIGIFFQLFDWNRRFAKKKLFSKKLLPPVRLKQSSKYGGDKKQAKLLLIADENSGGFPSVKNNKVCEKKRDMRSPGLVARLMGLESMPAVPQDRSKKVSSNATGTDKGEKLGNDTDKSGGEEPNLEKMGAKQEFRPQKFKKMGLSERQQVARFGTEVLQIKSMLLQSRKNQPKLASPVKSPRNVSVRNASRLVGVAARILEPGLQSRMKTALAYSNTLHQPSKQEAVSEEATDLAPDISDYSRYSMGCSNTVKSSCKNCGHFLDVMESRPEEEPSAIHSPVANYTERRQVSKRSMPGVPKFSTQEQNERHWKCPMHAAAVTMDVSYSTEPELEKKLTNRGQKPGHMTSQGCKLPNNGSSLGKSQLLPGRDIVPPRLQSSSLQSKRVSSAAKAINETKNFVAMNKSLSGWTRPMVPAKADIYNFGTERRFRNRSDSLSTVQKRRSMNTREDGSSGIANCTLLKESSSGSDSMRVKEIVHSMRPLNQSCTESKLACPQEPSQICSRHKGSDIESPIKQKTGKRAEVPGRKTHNNPCSDSTPGNWVMKESNGRKCTHKPFALRGDRLGKILEQKLKELTCHEDEFAGGVTTPRKTTAVILQELISALTAGTQIHQDDFPDKSDRKSDLSHPTNMSYENTSAKVQAKEKSATVLHDIDHFSPGTILEALFSSDESCLSSSLDERSRDKSIVESVDSYSDETHSSDPEADHLVSAAYSTIGKSCEVLVTDLVNNIPEVLQKINLVHRHLKGSNLSHAKEVLLNAELMLGNAAWCNPLVDKGFSIRHFLVHELETLESAIWMSFNVFLGFEDTKQENQLKVFIFDYVLEYLDSKFSRYSESGFRAWTNLLPCQNTEMLVSEILKEVKMWMALAGLVPDELIEWDMSHSLGKWTDFEIELYENGVEIERHILHNLVDEVVMDLCPVL